MQKWANLLRGAQKVQFLGPRFLCHFWSSRALKWSCRCLSLLLFLPFIIRSTNQPKNPPTYLPTNQTKKQTRKQENNQPSNEPTNHPTNSPTNQPTKRGKKRAGTPTPRTTYTQPIHTPLGQHPLTLTMMCRNIYTANPYFARAASPHSHHEVAKYMHICLYIFLFCLSFLVMSNSPGLWPMGVLR